MRSSKHNQRGTIVVQTQPQRRGPGLLGTMAQTAVIAGTATATSKAVSGAMGGGSQKAAAQQQAQLQAAQQQAQLQAAQQQAQLEAAAQRAVAEQQAALAAQQAAFMAQQPAAPAPTGLTDEKIAQLTQLGELHQAGILTDEEFASQKARLLAG
jgi:hypothetical protein